MWRAVMCSNCEGCHRRFPSQARDHRRFSVGKTWHHNGDHTSVDLQRSSSSRRRSAFTAVAAAAASDGVIVVVTAVRCLDDHCDKLSHPTRRSRMACSRSRYRESLRPLSQCGRGYRPSSAVLASPASRRRTEERRGRDGGLSLGLALLGVHANHPLFATCSYILRSFGADRSGQRRIVKRGWRTEERGTRPFRSTSLWSGRCFTMWQTTIMCMRATYCWAIYRWARAAYEKTGHYVSSFIVWYLWVLIFPVYCL